MNEFPLYIHDTGLFFITAIKLFIYDLCVLYTLHHLDGMDIGCFLTLPLLCFAVRPAQNRSW